MRAPEVSISRVSKPGRKFSDGIALPSPFRLRPAQDLWLARSFAMMRARRDAGAMGTDARDGASEGPYGPTHEPAQGGLSTQLLFDDPVIGIDDSSPHLRATAHRQATQARILPLPCLYKARHQP